MNWSAARDFLETTFWLCRPRPVLVSDRKLRRGRAVQRVWVSPTLRPMPADSVMIVLGSIDTSRIWTRRGVSPEDCAEMLSKAFGLPKTDEVVHGRQRVYRLDLAITEMLPEAWWWPAAVSGPDWLTIPSLAALGMGHAWLQVEGVLCDLHSGETVMALTHRTRRVAFIGPLFRASDLWRRNHRTADYSLDVLCTTTAIAYLQEIKVVLTR